MEWVKIFQNTKVSGATLLVKQNLVYQYISTQNIILKLQRKILTWKYKNKKTTVSIGNGFTPLYMRTTVTKLIARINDRIKAKKNSTGTTAPILLFEINLFNKFLTTYFAASVKLALVAPSSTVTS